MYWNAIKVFTYPLECLLMSFGWFVGDLSAICAASALGDFPFTQSARSANRAQITHKSPKRHKKDTRAGKWTLLLHFSAYSGHRIISHTFFLCPPLTINLGGYLWGTLEETITHARRRTPDITLLITIIVYVCCSRVAVVTSHSNPYPSFGVNRYNITQVQTVLGFGFSQRL